MPSVIATMTLMPASTASRIASAVNAAGTKIIVASAPVFLDGFGTVSNTGTPSAVCAALARRHAADHLRAVFQAVLGVKLARLAGDALADDAGVFVDQDAHGLIRSQLIRMHEVTSDGRCQSTRALYVAR